MSEKRREKELTRRSFMKGATVGAGAMALTAGNMTDAIAATPRQKWDKEADVIVIGFGGTGAAAAIVAHDAGAKVLVIEKTLIAGGNTSLSGGIVYAAASTLQKAAGITDSPEGMYKYWMANNDDLLDPELLRVTSEDSADVVRWLMSLGVEFTPEPYFSGLEEQYASVTPPIKRGHLVKGRGGALMKVLVRAVADRKIEVMYETPAERLIVNPAGEVIGVMAKGKRGKIYLKANRAVVLASGGFARNKNLVKSYFPTQIRAVPVVALGLTGDGLLMAEKIGSPIVNTGTVELPPSLPALEITPEEKALMFSSAYFLYKYPIIFVNQSGKRFCDESGYYQALSPLVLKQKAAFVIFDDKVKKAAGGSIGYGFSQDLKDEIEKGYLKTAPTIAELAKIIGVDPGELAETVARFNGYSKTGADTEYGRKKALGVIETPPFYAGKITAAVVESFGGVWFNTRAQVLDSYGEPIPRLYAGGAVTACLRAYPGSGAFLINCFVFGRIAGKNAAGEKPVGGKKG